MSQILIKRTTDAGKIPTSSDLGAGELGINLTDKKVYCGDGDSVFEIAKDELLNPVSQLLNLEIFGEYLVGRYYDNQNFVISPTNAETISSNNIFGNRIYLFPFYVGKNISIDRFGLTVNNAEPTTQMKIGLYSAQNGVLSLKVSDTLIDITTTGFKEITLSPNVELSSSELHYGALVANASNTECLRSFFPLLGFGKSSTSPNSLFRRITRVYVNHTFSDSFPSTINTSNFLLSDNNYEITHPLFSFRVA